MFIIRIDRESYPYLPSRRFIVLVYLNPNPACKASSVLMAKDAGKFWLGKFAFQKLLLILGFIYCSAHASLWVSTCSFAT